MKTITSTKETEVVHHQHMEPTISVNGQKLKVVDKFTYLGSTLSRAVQIDDEITASTAKASVAFGRLHASVWERLTPSRASTRLWYCQPSYTQVYYRHATKIIIHFHCFKKTVKGQMARQDPRHRGPEEGKMHSDLKLAQLRWTVHVIKMSDERFPKN